MSEENHSSQYPEWQDTYLETAYSLPYVDTQSQPSYDSPPPQLVSQPVQQPGAQHSTITSLSKKLLLIKPLYNCVR
jgi:hypothetical protein